MKAVQSLEELRVEVDGVGREEREGAYVVVIM